MSILDSEGLIELRRARARNYSRIFLTKNPFPATPIPEDTPPITVDREGIIAHFQEIIANAYEDARITVTVIVGAYGSGKSHLLKLFKKSVNGKLMTDEQGCVAVYVRTPGRSFLDFFSNFVDDIRASTMTSLSIRLISKFLQMNRDHLSEFIVDKKSEKKIEGWLKDPSQFVLNSVYIDLFKSIRDTYLPDVGNSDALLAFASLSHPDINSTAWRWFLGDKLNKDERRLLEVDKNIDDEPAALSVFQALLRLFKISGMASTVVLVDEFEKLVQLGGVARAEYQDNLRRIIDDNPTGMNIFIAVAPKEHEEFSSESSAFARRLAGDVQELKKLNIDQSASLIEEYLAPVRVKGFRDANVDKKFDPSTFPFTKTAIQAIRDKTDGNTGYILLACRRCIEYIIQTRMEVVDDKVVDIVSKKYGGLK